MPFVPGVPLPPELLKADKPLIVGLTNDPERLIHLRRNRLSLLDHNEATDYTDIEAVRAEVREARRVFARASLAGDRRHPPLDRGDRLVDLQAADAAAWQADAPERIVLASASTARAALLRAAGVEFAIEPAAIDEARDQAGGAARRQIGDRLCAVILATEKARAVSRARPRCAGDRRRPDARVGHGMVRQAARSRRGARRSFSRLRGRTHILATAVCVVAGRGAGMARDERCRN